MRINVSQQLKSPIGSTRNYDVSEIVNLAGGDSLVEGKVTLVCTDRGILARATLHTVIEVTCSRCLSVFNCPLTLNIEEEYFPITDVASGTALPLPEERSSFLIDEHHILDLTEVIRQYVLLIMPMKPLCREDCAGLCSTCGYDLNQGPCNCLPQQADPQWPELSKMASNK